MKHTQEPWTNQFNSKNKTTIWAKEGLILSSIDCMSVNAARIVECVNALAGIENPKKWVDKITTENEALQTMREDYARVTANLIIERDENTTLKKVLRESDNTLITISWDGVKPIRLELEEQIEELKLKLSTMINLYEKQIENSIKYASNEELEQFIANCKEIAKLKGGNK